MKTLRTVLLLIILALLTACGGRAAPNNSPDSNASGGSQIALPAVSAGGEESGPIDSDPNAQPPVEPGRPDSFDLQDPAIGLDTLASYRAVLQMTFSGTQHGNPYYREKAYIHFVNREQDARLLMEVTTDQAGVSTELLSALIGPVQYIQAGPDADCQVNLRGEVETNLFEPAKALPHLTGAETAGQETIGNVPTNRYQFDERALGITGATAAGSIWIAQQGGWVVKYELSLTSDQVFGEGISGEQRWEYEINDVGETQVSLPGSCPLLSDFPVPEGAEQVTRMPGYLRFTIDLPEPDLGAFYEEQLIASGWLAMSDPPESAVGTRWSYQLTEGEYQQIALIQAKPSENGLEVTVFQMETEILPE